MMPWFLLSWLEVPNVSGSLEDREASPAIQEPFPREGADVL